MNHHTIESRNHKQFCVPSHIMHDNKANNFTNDGHHWALGIDLRSSEYKIG